MIGQDVSESETTAPVQRTEAQLVQSMPLNEAWDVLELVKRLADEGDGEKARALLEMYPQLLLTLTLIQVRERRFLYLISLIL